MLRTSLVSAAGNLLKLLMPWLLCIGLVGCGGRSGDDAATLKAAVTTVPGAVTGTSTLLATSAAVQDYTYLSQFGTLGNGNGQFHGAAGVAIDPTSHNIVVTDQLNHRVQIFNSAGAYLSQFGTQGSGNGQFGRPVGVAIDPTSHNIVVADPDNNRVQIFNSAGAYLGQFGTPGSGNGQFNFPIFVAIDPTSHNIVVTDAANNRVQTFNSEGAYLSQFGTQGSGNGQFHQPIGVAIDPTSHNIVVTEQINERVQIFNSEGAYLSQFGTQGSGNGQFTAPTGVVIDPTSHNIVVADQSNHRVQIFDSAGAYLSQFGTFGSGSGKFFGTYGVVIDPTSHNIIVTDISDNRVQIFAPVAPTSELKVIGPASEPSIAVDPLNPLHAVVGFNDDSSILATKCGWAESWDGGKSWSPKGSLRLPDFIHVGDPWVRYGPDGTLYYSCLGRTLFQGSNPFFRVSTHGVFVAVSRPHPGSLAGASSSDFEVAMTVLTTKVICTTLKCEEADNAGEKTDHPAIGILKNTDGSTRLAICSIEDFEPAGSKFVTITIVDDDGKVLSKPSRPIVIGGPNANVCTVGTSDSTVGVTWFDGNDGWLKLRTSIDGKKWSRPPVTLAYAGSLAPNSKGFPTSTSTQVLSEPYALVLPDQNGLLQAVWQERSATAGGYISQVYVGPAVNNSHSMGASALGDANAEKFLPGTGRCGRIAGAYQVTDVSKGFFRYMVWSLDKPGQSELIFTSGADLDPGFGKIDSRFPGFRRIGDYTGVDCSGNFGWAAWTDLRNGQPEIWAVRIPLSK